MVRFWKRENNIFGTKPTALGEPISPNSGFKFRAQTPSDGLAWAGEAYAVSHKGIAYYWLSWCEEREFDVIRRLIGGHQRKTRLRHVRDAHIRSNTPRTSDVNLGSARAAFSMMVDRTAEICLK